MNKTTLNPDSSNTKEVPGFPNYRVGTDGSIWSRHNNRHGPGAAWRKLAPYISRGATGTYAVVDLIHNGLRVHWPVHKVVMLAHVGPRPAGHDIRHLDGDGTNNNLANLRYGTRAENEHDKLKHGRSRRGIHRNPQAKLNVEKVIDIRQLSASGESQSKIAKRFGVVRETVRDVLRKKTWSYV